MLTRIAYELRKDVIRMLEAAKSGHPGGSLSAADLLTVLYFDHMNFPAPTDPDRDRFVLSKGHGVPIQYAIFARMGIITPDELPTLRKLGSRLQGHPVVGTIPGIEASTGSLGQGLSVALGMALSARVLKKKFRVYCMLGDGEMQEGQVWEALLSAGSKHKPSNLTVILDYNKAQIDGFVKDVLELEPLKAKLEAFGWRVWEIDGHNIPVIQKTFKEAAQIENAPQFIIAHTIKGKGVSFMEGKVEWHGVAPSRDQADKAIAELDAFLQGLPS